MPCPHQARILKGYLSWKQLSNSGLKWSACTVKMPHNSRAAPSRLVVHLTLFCHNLIILSLFISHLRTKSVTCSHMLLFLCHLYYFLQLTKSNTLPISKSHFDRKNACQMHTKCMWFTASTLQYSSCKYGEGPPTMPAVCLHEPYSNPSGGGIEKSIAQGTWMGTDSII